MTSYGRGFYFSIVAYLTRLGNSLRLAYITKFALAKKNPNAKSPLKLRGLFAFKSLAAVRRVATEIQFKSDNYPIDRGFQ